MRKEKIDMTVLVIFFYKNVQKGYLKLARKKLNKYSIIDANLDKSINEKIIIKKIHKIFNK